MTFSEMRSFIGQIELVLTGIRGDGYMSELRAHKCAVLGQ